MPHTPRHRRCLFSDIGEFNGAWPFVDRGVGDENGVAFAHHQMDAKGRPAFFGVKHMTEFAKSLSKCAGDAGNHRVGLIHSQ